MKWSTAWLIGVICSLIFFQLLTLQIALTASEKAEDQRMQIIALTVEVQRYKTAARDNQRMIDFLTDGLKANWKFTTDAVRYYGGSVRVPPTAGTWLETKPAK